MTRNRLHTMADYLIVATDSKQKNLDNVQTHWAQPGHGKRPTQADLAAQRGQTELTVREGRRQSYTSSQRGQTELTVREGRRQSYTSSQRGQTELTLQSGRGRDRATLPHREDRLSSHCSQGGAETELHFLTERTDWAHTAVREGWRQSYTSSQRGQTELTLQSGRGRDRATLPHREDRLSSHCSQGGVETELHFLTERTEWAHTAVREW